MEAEEGGEKNDFEAYAEGEVSLCTVDCNGQCGESSYFEYPHKSVVEGGERGVVRRGMQLAV
jgi:hypothetical protein